MKNLVKISLFALCLGVFASCESTEGTDNAETAPVTEATAPVEPAPVEPAPVTDSNATAPAADAPAADAPAADAAPAAETH